MLALKLFVVLFIGLMGLLRTVIAVKRAQGLPLRLYRVLIVSGLAYALCGGLAGDWLVDMVLGLAGYPLAPGLGALLAMLGLTATETHIETLHILGIVGYTALTFFLNRIEGRYVTQR
jgi:hypothetical protein